MSTLKVNEIQDTSGTVRRGIQTYAIICDQKAQNTSGGTATTGAWRTRDLNTEIADPDSIVSIASNQFTLGAGTYLIEASAPLYRVDDYGMRLYNVTSSSVVQAGQSGFAASSYNVHNHPQVFARVTITGSTTFEIQQRFARTETTYGFGVQGNVGVEIYTVVRIFKEA
jgi:hypothetical protein